jgi:apolipoprotein D and lipocalin family protein
LLALFSRSPVTTRGFIINKFTCSLAAILTLGLPTWVHATDAPQAPVASVASVDLNRYIGKWYEIGSFPLFFQRNCMGDTTAQYALEANARVSVTNRCRTASGFDEAVGHASVVDGSANARLKVSFFWPFKADYWVIGLDPDYRWAVVGNPNRKYLWVLSRTPQLPQALLDAALASASAQGFDLSQLRYTQQTPVSAP